MYYADQVLKEHINSLPAKRKKAHRRASRHALRHKHKRQPSLTQPNIQTASGEVGSVTGISRGSVSSVKTLRSVDMTPDPDTGKYMYMHVILSTP